MQLISLEKEKILVMIIIMKLERKKRKNISIQKIYKIILNNLIKFY